MRKYLLLFVILSLIFCKGENASNHKINLSGVISLNQNKTADISSLVEGKAVSLLADLGEKVQKGQILLLLNSREFSQVKADFFRSMTNLDIVRKEFKRAILLLKKKDIEEEEFLRIKDEYSKAMNHYDASKSNLLSLGLVDSQIESLIKKHEAFKKTFNISDLNEPYLSIISPISGTIIFRDAIIGEHIEPGKILFTISDLSYLWVLFDVNKKDLTFIKKDSVVRMKTPLYPDKVFEGKITYISDKIDEELRTLRVRAEVNNKYNLLKTNMFIIGIIEKEIKLILKSGDV